MLKKHEKVLLVIIVMVIYMIITACSFRLLPYSPNTAIANGDVVSVHGKTTNLDRLDEFISKVHSGENDKIQVTTYTIEGDAIISTLSFDGKIIECKVDTRRDAFAGQGGKKITKYKFTRIDKEVN